MSSATDENELLKLKFQTNFIFQSDDYNHYAYNMKRKCITQRLRRLNPLLNAFAKTLSFVSNSKVKNGKRKIAKTAQETKTSLMNLENAEKIKRKLYLGQSVDQKCRANTQSKDQKVGQIFRRQAASFFQ